MIDTTEAVRLAAEAMRATVYQDCPHEEADPYDACLDCGATAAVTAALPALAEQFAALIEATCRSDQHSLFDGLCGGCEDAAQIVREAAEVTL
jgi:hypothetical protein